MTRTPNEIKKGLECKKRVFADSCYDRCATCELFIPCYGTVERCADALALIKQLEADKQQLEGMLTHMNQLRDAAAGRALKMEERVHQLEAERDAAITFLPRRCHLCKHVGNKMGDAPCPSFCEYITLEECPNWQWRGVQKEN